MLSIDIFEIGAFVKKKGVATWQGLLRAGDTDADIEPMGQGDVFQGLGLTSAPYPQDERGKAEGVAVRGIGGRLLTWLGGRDTRSAAIVGNMGPGDTVVHSTGPSQAAQVQLKEEKRQVVAATKDPNGKTMVILLDGTANKLQFVLAGMIFEMNGADKSMTMTNGECSILMQGGTICLDGDVILGGKVGDPVNKIAVAPLPPGPPVSPGIALTFGAAPGVSIALPTP